MADPILVSQIISSMGLSGKAAEEKRLELERLTNDELTKILANSAEFKQGDVGSFSALSQTGSKKPQAVWGADLQGYTLGLERQSTPETPKKLSVGREKELRNFAADYLSDAASGAKESFAAYRNGFGYVSPDAVWHGLKNIADWTLKLNDKVNPYNVLTGNKSSGAVTTLNEQDELIEKAMVSAQKLNALKDGRKASFEIEFERQRGKSFDAQKAEKFKNIADTYVEMTAVHDRYEVLAGGFSDVRSILKQEEEYEHARKTVKGAAAAQLEPPKVSSNERFGQILMQFCGGNKELFDEYMNGLSKEYKTPEEIKKHLPEIMEKLQTRAEKETNNILKGKSYAAYTKEYENAFKDTFGDEDIEKLTEGWIQTQRTGAEYTKMAITLAATVMIGNSAGAGKFAQGIASRYGTQTAGTAMKAMFTLGAPAMNMTMDYASALSSSDGLTEERNSQILQGAVMSLPYTIFGSYVSGPIGDVVKAYCKSAPAFMPNILNKAFAAAPKAASAAGLGVEITADTVFACAMEDTSFTDALAREGSTDTGMRVAGKVMTAFIGGRAHGASKQVMARVEEELKGYKIAELKKPDGTVNYKLTTPEGKAVVTDGEGLMSGIFAAAGGVVERNTSFKNMNSLTEALNQNGKSYQIYTDKSGKKLVKIVNSFTEVAGKKLGETADYYVYDKNGQLVSQTYDLKKSKAQNAYKKFFAECKEPKTIDNSKNSGNLNMGFPFFDRVSSKIKLRQKRAEALKEIKKPTQEQKTFIDKVLELNPEAEIASYRSLTGIMGEGINFLQKTVDSLAKLASLSNENIDKNLGSLIYDSLQKDTKTISDFINELAESGLPESKIQALCEASPPKEISSICCYFHNPEQLNVLTTMLKDLNDVPLESVSRIPHLFFDFRKNLLNSSSEKKEVIYNFIQTLPESVKSKLKANGLDMNVMQKIAKAGIQIKGYEIKTSKDKQNAFLDSWISNNNTNSQKILTGNEMKEFIEKYRETGIPLKYTRSSYTKDITSLLEQLPKSEKQKVLQDLNIELNEKSFEGILNPEKLDVSKYSDETQNIVSNIKEKSKEFVFKNEILTDNLEIKTLLEDLTKGFPEFMSMSGKMNDCNLSMDINAIEVYIKSMNDINLSPGASDKDKTMLKLTVLMKDLGALEKSNDKDYNAMYSTTLGGSILDKFSISQDVKERVLNLIENQYFSLDKNNIMQTYFRTGRDSRTATILASNDKSLTDGTITERPKYHYYTRTKAMLLNKAPAAYKKYPKEKMMIDGKEVMHPILRLSELSLDTDMSVYGYEPNTKLKDVTLQIHNTNNYFALLNLIECYDNKTKHATISTSVKKLLDSQNGYGDITAILSTSKQNQGGGDYRSLVKTWGWGKDMESFFKESSLDYPLLDNDSNARSAINKYFASINSPAQIKDLEVNGKLYKKEELYQIWKNDNDNITQNTNEIFALDPKVVGIIIDQKNFDNMPDDVKKVLHEKNITIHIR